jgi:hypothetical protein
MRFPIFLGSKQYLSKIFLLLDDIVTRFFGVK